MARSRYITIGRIGAPHGLDGWVRVFTYTDPPENILHYHPWAVGQEGQWQSREYIDGKPHRGHFIVKFEGIDDRDMAQTLTHQHIAILRDQLPEPDDGHFYWTDLENLAVLDEQGHALGTIDYLFSTQGSNDVIVVKTATGQEILLPYLDQVIKNVDLTAGTMTVHWPLDDE